jgi:nitrate reductase NapD
MSTREIHISSVVVHVKPRWLAPVRRSVERMGECEVVTADDSGKLVLVIETGDTRRISDTIERIQGLEGVVNTVMAYHHCEDESALNEELPNDTDPS